MSTKTQSLDVTREKSVIKEYIDALNQIILSLGDYDPDIMGMPGQLRHKFHHLELLLRKLELPAKNLNQRISQLIEHGKIEELDRLELMLYLAELEYALNAADQSISALHDKSL